MTDEEKLKMAELEMQVDQYRSIFDRIRTSLRMNDVVTVETNEVVRIMTERIEQLQLTVAADKVLLAQYESSNQNAGKVNEYNAFIGPCIHGRDPIERCDKCNHLTGLEALIQSNDQLRKLTQYIHRELNRSSLFHSYSPDKQTLEGCIKFISEYDIAISRLRGHVAAVTSSNHNHTITVDDLLEIERMDHLGDTENAQI